MTFLNLSSFRGLCSVSHSWLSICKFILKKQFVSERTIGNKVEIKWHGPIELKDNTGLNIIIETNRDIKCNGHIGYGSRLTSAYGHIEVAKEVHDGCTLIANEDISVEGSTGYSN